MSRKRLHEIIDTIMLQRFCGHREAFEIWARDENRNTREVRWRMEKCRTCRVPDEIKQCQDLLLPDGASRPLSASDLADALGEKDAAPREAIAKVVDVMGLLWSFKVYQKTLEIEANGGMLVYSKKFRRTIGGVFFVLVKHKMPESERVNIFPQTAQPQPKSTQPKPKSAILHFGEMPATAEAGKVKTVKITLTGRPEHVVTHATHIVFQLKQNKVPGLPKGLPAPRPLPTTYRVFVAKKQWDRAMPALLSDLKDFLIIEGLPQIDESSRVIDVFGPFYEFTGARSPCYPPSPWSARPLIQPLPDAPVLSGVCARVRSEGEQSWAKQQTEKHLRNGLTRHSPSEIFSLFSVFSAPLRAVL